MLLFYFDYLGLLVLLLIEIVTPHEYDDLELPDGVFDPRFSVFHTSDPSLFSIRYFSVQTVLSTTEHRIDDILQSLVRYPLLFAEIVDICSLHVNMFDKFANRKMARRFGVRETLYMPAGLDMGAAAEVSDFHFEMMKSSFTAWAYEMSIIPAAYLIHCKYGLLCLMGALHWSMYQQVCCQRQRPSFGYKFNIFYCMGGF
jgi:hypothetical protein